MPALLAPRHGGVIAKAIKFKDQKVPEFWPLNLI
jgi:hypothetical protein